MPSSDKLKGVQRQPRCCKDLWRTMACQRATQCRKRDGSSDEEHWIWRNCVDYIRAALSFGAQAIDCRSPLEGTARMERTLSWLALSSIKLKPLQIVTSYLDSAARNMGFKEQVAVSTTVIAIAAEY
jgi:hypothetical protein